MVQRVLSKRLVRTWCFFSLIEIRDWLMRERYIASGRMVYHGMEFGCQADYNSNHTYLSLVLEFALVATS